MLLPCCLYFTKHRSQFLKTVLKKKYTGEAPEVNPGKIHHAKEFGIRLFFGFFIGNFTSVYLYGEPTVVVDPKVAEILGDEESLKYAQYMKEQKRDAAKAKNG